MSFSTALGFPYELRGGTTLVATRNFRQLVEAMPPERQRFQESLALMPLDELRKAREMTQLQLGEALAVHQSEVSKIERRS